MFMCKIKSSAQFLVISSQSLTTSSARLLATSQGLCRGPKDQSTSAHFDRRLYGPDKRNRNPFRVPRWFRPNLKEINSRQERIAFDQENRYGAEEVPRRSAFIEWNYDAELAAFQARIGEQFDPRMLRQAFVTKDYLEDEYLSKKSLGIGDQSQESSSSSSESSSETSDAEEQKQLSPADNDAIRSSSNFEMAVRGEDILDEVVAGYVRTAFPWLPEEGVRAIHAFLTTDEKLAHVSFHIGTMDLILSKEYPPTVRTMADTFRALVSALWQSGSQPETSQARTRKFVVDVVATQLDNQDLVEVWDVPDPVNTLVNLCRNQGMEEPESRLLWASGKGTIMACYHVGFYSGQELIGQAPGESAEIAEEMAARDVLRRMFRCDYDTSAPMPFSAKALAAKTNSPQLKFKTTPNIALAEWSTQKAVPETVSVV